MPCVLHMTWVKKNTLILEKQYYVFRFIRLYRWRIPLNTEYRAAEAGDVFIDSLKLQNSFLVTTHNAEVTGAGAQRREPKAVRFWRPVDRLVNGRSPAWLSLTPRPHALSRTACTNSTDGERNQKAKATRPITV